MLEFIQANDHSVVLFVAKVLPINQMSKDISRTVLNMLLLESIKGKSSIKPELSTVGQNKMCHNVSIDVVNKVP